MRKISEKKENHEVRKTKKQIKSEGSNWKKCTMKKLQHEKSATGEDMHKKRGAT